MRCICDNLCFKAFRGSTRATRMALEIRDESMILFKIHIQVPSFYLNNII